MTHIKPNRNRGLGTAHCQNFLKLTHTHTHSVRRSLWRRQINRFASFAFAFFFCGLVTTWRSKFWRNQCKTRLKNMTCQAGKLTFSFWNQRIVEFWLLSIENGVRKMIVFSCFCRLPARLLAQETFRMLLVGESWSKVERFDHDNVPATGQERIGGEQKLEPR